MKIKHGSNILLVNSKLPINCLFQEEEIICLDDDDSDSSKTSAGNRNNISKSSTTSTNLAQRDSSSQKQGAPKVCMIKISLGDGVVLYAYLCSVLSFITCITSELQSCISYFHVCVIF